MKLKQLFRAIKTSWLITAKNSIQQKAMLIAIPGVYQRDWEEGVNKFMEQITIRQISTIAEMYRVKKTIFTHHTLNKKVIHKHKIDEWMATYDYSKRQLHEVAGQRQCSFIPDDAILYVDKTGYSKVKTNPDNSVD